MDDSPLELEGDLLVVDGTHWTCYIRCVLHGLGAMAHYDDVIRRIGLANIDLTNGVNIGSRQETQIQNHIIAVTGSQYYVQATDAASADQDMSANQVGTRIDLVVTGVHFSLLQ